MQRKEENLISRARNKASKLNRSRRGICWEERILHESYNLLNNRVDLHSDAILQLKRINVAGRRQGEIVVVNIELDKKSGKTGTKSQLNEAFCLC